MLGLIKYQRKLSSAHFKQLLAQLLLFHSQKEYGCSSLFSILIKYLVVILKCFQ